MAIQQLTQPIINPISAFDSTRAHTISFVVIGGAQVIGNRLVISNNQTGKEIYNKIQSTMKLEHLIPANTLTNGGYYNAVVYTIDSANNESVASAAVPFYCYSQPNLTIDNIPATETIENGTYKFVGNYLQQENELLNSYQYTLYDSNKNVLSQSALIYYDTDSSLSYTFVGMSNDTAYYIELSGETVNGTKITSGLKYFTVRYIQPASFAICDLVNNCEDGYIQISSNIVAIDGKSNPDPPIYIDDKEVDLRDPNSWVEWNSGFRIQDDFTMRVWGRDFNDYQNIITLTNDINTTSTPNRIELKWMVGDVIKTLPSYTTVEGKSVNILDAEAAKIENLSIGGNLEQKTEDEIDFGTDKYLTINTDKSLPLQINVLGNSEQKTSTQGKNLIIPQDYTVTGNGITITSKNGVINVKGTATQSISFEVPINKINLDGTYYFSTKITGTVHANICAIRFYNENHKNFIDKWYTFDANTQPGFSGDMSGVTGYIFIYLNPATVDFNIYPQLEVGTQKTEYEPFIPNMPSPDYPSEVQTVGSNGSVKVTKCNKNILPLENKTSEWDKAQISIINNELTIKPNSNGNIPVVLDGNVYPFSLNKGTTITISWIYKNGNLSLDTGAIEVDLKLDYDDGTTNSLRAGDIVKANQKSTSSQTITLKKNVKSIHWYVFGWENRNAKGSSTYNLQLEIGSKVTSFEQHEEQSYILPVQQEMLEGDLFTQGLNKKEIHHWKKMIFDGTEDGWIRRELPSGGYRFEFPLSIIALDNNQSVNVICDRLKGVTADATYLKIEGISASTWMQVYLNNLSQSTVNDFKVWLQNHPLTVYYKLKTPTSIDCTSEQSNVLDELNQLESYSPQTNIYTDDIALLNAKYLGLPNPYNPSKIYSLGDIKNLIDIPAFNIKYDQQYFQSTNTNFILKPNFIYTLSFDYNVNKTSTDLYYSIGYGTNGYDVDLKSNIQYQSLTKGRNSVSFIVPENIPNNASLWVKFAQTIILADINVDISNIQLESGNISTNYEDPNLYNIYPTSASKNLFNYDSPVYLLKNNATYTPIQNGYNIKPTVANQDAYIGIGIKNVLNSGDIYTISFSQLGQFEKFNLYTTEKGNENIISEIPINNNSFVAPEGVYDLQLVFGVDSSNLSNYIEIWNIQIEANNVISEYEPYVSNSAVISLDEPLRGLGEYRDLICLESPNILNPETQSGIVKGNTTYYLNQSGNTQYYIWYYNEDGNLIKFIDTEGHEASGITGIKGSFTTHKDCVKITITKSSNPNSEDITADEIKTNQVGITKGNNAQVYYPYVTEPSIIRYIKETTLNGTENWLLDDTYKGIAQFSVWVNALYINDSNIRAISNYFKGVYFSLSWEKNNTVTIKGGGSLRFMTNEYTSVDDFKAWLSNNDVKVCYVLKTPVVTSLSEDNINALKMLSTYKPISNVFTNNEILGYLKLDYVSDYTEQQTQNAYVLLKCWNANSMPYICHSNYIDIPDGKDKVFIWMRRKNNLFDLKIENLGDYNEDDKPTDKTKPIVTLEINPNNVEATRIPVTAYSIDDNGLKTVRFSKDNGNTWDEIVNVDGLSSTNSYIFINLNPNTTYTIRVEAIDLAGNIGGISQQVTTKSS